MAAGLTATLTAQQYQTIQGTLCQSLLTLLLQIDELKAFNDAQGSAGIQALPAASGGLQITSGDAATMISAVTNMKTVADAARGTVAITPAASQIVFVLQCVGTGVR